MNSWWTCCLLTFVGDGRTEGDRCEFSKSGSSVSLESSDWASERPGIRLLTPGFWGLEIPQGRKFREYIPRDLAVGILVRPDVLFHSFFGPIVELYIGNTDKSFLTDSLIEALKAPC